MACLGVELRRPSAFHIQMCDEISAADVSHGNMGRRRTGRWASPTLRDSREKTQEKRGEMDHETPHKRLKLKHGNGK